MPAIIAVAALVPVMSHGYDTVEPSPAARIPGGRAVVYHLKMTNQIDIETTEPGVALVSLRGEHDAYSAQRLARQIAILQFEGYAVVIDLAETSFIDSTIVSTLLRARREAEQLGLKFSLVLDDTTGWSVRRLLELTRLDKVFSISRSPRAVAG